MPGRKKGIDCGGPRAKFCRERQMAPGRCAPGSTRTVKRGKNRIVVCCPKGRFKRGRCTVGMRAQSILRPFSSAKCSVCRVK